MTNTSSAHPKASPTLADLSIMDDTTDTKRSKRTAPLLMNYHSTMNLMKFMEISPLDPINKPHPRSGHRAVATESDLWIWGGYFPSEHDEPPQMFEELWRFNFALRQWTLERTTGDGPTSTLASHSMCLYRNLVFVFGGTGFPFGRDVSNDLFILDLKRRHWIRCPLLNDQPEEVYGASMIIKDDHLYVLCGINSQHYHTDVYDIHLTTMTCTKIGYTFDEIENTIENGRYRQEVYIHENRIFVFGGGGSLGMSFSLENLPVFDLTTLSWSFVQTNPDPRHNFPVARKFHSIVPFRPNQIIMFGGADFSPILDHHVFVGDHLWLFDFEKLQWTMLQSLKLLIPTFFHAAAINERGELYIHGGIVKESTMSHTQTRTTALCKMHTRVLKLSEISWNYFLNRLPDRTCLIKQPQLMSQLHIPAQFVERIY